MTTYEDETGYVWEKRVSPPPLDWKPGQTILVRGATFAIMSIRREICAPPREPHNRVIMRGLDTQSEGR